MLSLAESWSLCRCLQMTRTGTPRSCMTMTHGTPGTSSGCSATRRADGRPTCGRTGPARRPLPASSSSARGTCKYPFMRSAIVLSTGCRHALVPCIALFPFEHPDNSVPAVTDASSYGQLAPLSPELIRATVMSHLENLAGFRKAHSASQCRAYAVGAEVFVRTSL